MLLYIVRHGIPDYATDTLTEDGAKQAEAVAHRLVPAGIDEVYASPLGRARQTAEPTCRALGLEMQIEPFMSENTAWHHLTALKEDRRTWAFTQRALILGSDESYDAKDGYGRGIYADDEKAREGMAIIREGSDAFLAKLGYEKTGVGNGYRATAPNDKHIAAFCHQGFGLHWLAYLLNLPVHIFTATFDISHTGVTVISFSAGSDGIAYPHCLCLSDISHIYGDGLPMLYHNHLPI